MTIAVPLFLLMRINAMEKNLLIAWGCPLMIYSKFLKGDKKKLDNNYNFFY